MKVQGANSSSRKTRRYIKTAFAELINEKKELNKITVTELVKKADITRSTFYTHYDSIYEVANDYQLETIDLLINDDKILNSKDDILNYFDEIINCLKQNEHIYKLLLSSTDSLNFLIVLRKMANQKLYYTLKNNYKNYDTLELDVSFFIAGMVEEIIIYFKSQSDYTLDELLVNIKKWFEKIFD
ncbi:MAG: TetR/AcrR family transcriptional regulator [Clostridia bacterium]|nr:TetR/AcrR family transcriptional regulator [Clostridia bacterium]